MGLKIATEDRKYKSCFRVSLIVHVLQWGLLFLSNIQYWILATMFVLGLGVVVGVVGAVCNIIAWLCRKMIPEMVQPMFSFLVTSLLQTISLLMHWGPYPVVSLIAKKLMMSCSVWRLSSF